MIIKVYDLVLFSRYALIWMVVSETNAFFLFKFIFAFIANPFSVARAVITPEIYSLALICSSIAISFE